MDRNDYPGPCPKYGPFSLAVVLLLTVLCCAHASPDERQFARSEIPIPLQLQIFLKIVTYDRSFDQDKPGPFRVGVFLKNTGEGGVESTFRQVSEVLSKKTILGRPLSPVKIVMRNGVFPKIGQLPDMLVLIGNWDEDGEKVAEYARKKKLVTFGSSIPLLESGIVVVLTLDGDRPVIHVNLNEARAVGADFHANFLKHCQVVR